MRLLTRSDFDGLICAVLLKELGLMDSWKFVHPKDVQDGLITAGPDDILANVPFAPGCGMWFDHHSSEEERNLSGGVFTGASKSAPSCARVIWDYFGGHAKFPARFDEMMRYVDKCDSGDLSIDEVQNPSGWVLLSFVMDPRTGLGRYRDYTISNLALMDELIGLIRSKSIEDLLALPDVTERTRRYFEQHKLFVDMIMRTSAIHDNVVIVDLRGEEEIFTGNRFLIYALFPLCNVSVQVVWGVMKQNTVFTVGHSVINRTCKTNVGSLMLQYGGGGHPRVGACQVDNGRAGATLEAIVDTLTAAG
ncbi:MAG: exopolyphosphatase [Desulfovibrionaceae bacterium]|nr:exopolyphosphatase [Desulfovibrionaceae bacterium]MBF0515261.1 exopolyphosphatase [Desulfovibrionaceae bacterium]